jgi:hypothetical protein
LRRGQASPKLGTTRILRGVQRVRARFGPKFRLSCHRATQAHVGPLCYTNRMEFSGEEALNAIKLDGDHSADVLEMSSEGLVLLQGALCQLHRLTTA